jgi:hypothetical protein
MNPYLKKLREQYDALKTSNDGLLTRAAEASRDLDETELRTVKEQGEKAATLYTQIEMLTEEETRSRKVAEMASILTEDDGEKETQTRVSGTSAKDRDPGHYRSVRDGGKHSFFADLHGSKHGDQGAARRLTEHTRALTLLDEGPGITPPKWMAEEWASIQRQTRRVAAAVRNIPIANAAPLSLPKQTAAAGTIVQQTTEETTTTFTDGWDSAVTSVQPTATAGGQKVTRVMLDSGNPAVDRLIWDDLIADYDTKIEARVVAAMITAAGSATVTYATEAAWTTGLDPLDATYVGDAILDTAIAVRNGRKMPADILVASVNRYGSLLKIKDSTGRPIIPGDSGGPMNVFGVGSVDVDGRLSSPGLGVLASDGITQYAESLLVARAADTLLFESPIQEFSYEQPDGPEVIRLGIWAYAAVHVKYTSSVERVAITAAS